MTEYEGKCQNCGELCEEMDLEDSPEYQMSVCSPCAKEVKELMEKEINNG